MSETSHCTHEASLRGASSFAKAMEDKIENRGGSRHRRRGGVVMRRAGETSNLASDPCSEERVDKSPRALPFIDKLIFRKPLDSLLDRAGAGDPDAFKET